MKYTGGKHRLAKHIGPFIQELLGDTKGAYYEPFVGGANMFCRIKHPVKFGSDVDKELVEFLNYLVKHGADNLPYITKEIYLDAKNNPESKDPWYLGYVSICGSFQGQKWAGYAGAKQYKSQYHDYPLEALNNLKKQEFDKNDLFFNSSYLDLDIPPNSVVYCDPPYQNTKGYKSGKFDHAIFWGWVRVQTKHCKVLVSEYKENVPQDFKVIWRKERKSTTGLVKAKTKVETLSVFKS